MYLLLPAFLLSMLFKCLKATRSADLIHANWAICGAIAGLAGKLSGVPVVTTLRGDDVTRAQRTFLDRLILSLCMRLSNHVVCVSTSIAAWVRGRYPECADKTSVIENGVEDVFLRLPMDRDTRSAGSQQRFVTVGSLIPRKNIDLIIAALQRMPQRDGVLLTVLGDGPERGRLEALADASGLHGNVEFAGAMPPASVPDALANAHVFVLASKSEGRPNAVLEAMAAGLPVIASNIAGVDELVQHGITGFLFQPDSVDELAHYMQMLRQDADLQIRLGHAAREAVTRRQLLWRATAEKYFRLFRTVSERP
jgi:glycosyltransferase involved in cell wall biosynthesis